MLKVWPSSRTTVERLAPFLSPKSCGCHWIDAAAGQNHTVQGNIEFFFDPHVFPPRCRRLSSLRTGPTSHVSFVTLVVFNTMSQSSSVPRKYMLLTGHLPLTFREGLELHEPSQSSFTCLIFFLWDKDIISVFVKLRMLEVIKQQNKNSCLLKVFWIPITKFTPYFSLPLTFKIFF